MVTQIWDLLSSELWPESDPGKNQAGQSPGELSKNVLVFAKQMLLHSWEHNNNTKDQGNDQ